VIGDAIAASLTKPGLGAKYLPGESSGQVIGYAMQNYDGTVQTNNNTLIVDTGQEAVIEVFVNLGWYHLDYNAASLPDGEAPNKSNFWKTFAVDPNTYHFKIAYGLDLQGNDITNVGSIIGENWQITKEGELKIKSITSENFQIKEDGTIEATRVFARDLLTLGSAEKPAGIEFFDLKTTQIRCAVFLNGSLQSFIGECSQENLQKIAKGDFLTLESSSHLDSSISEGQVQREEWTIDQTRSRPTPGPATSASSSTRSSARRS
jgi:hypothetical protein